MKSILIMAGRNGFGDLAFDLDPQMVRKHEFFTGDRSAFGHRKDGGQHRHGWVHQQSVYAIFSGGKLRVVEIICVNGYAVYKRGETGRGFYGRADDRGFSVADAKLPKVLPANRSGLCARSRQRQTQAIKDGLLAKLDDAFGDILIPCCSNEFADILCQARSPRKFAAGHASRSSCRTGENG